MVKSICEKTISEKLINRAFQSIFAYPNKLKLSYINMNNFYIKYNENCQAMQAF